jgi:hypothetical protein
MQRPDALATRRRKSACAGVNMSLIQLLQAEFLKFEYENFDLWYARCSFEK